jgi:hypothetical protein
LTVYWICECGLVGRLGVRRRLRGKAGQNEPWPGWREPPNDNDGPLDKPDQREENGNKLLGPMNKSYLIHLHTSRHSPKSGHVISKDKSPVSVDVPILRATRKEQIPSSRHHYLQHHPNLLAGTCLHVCVYVYTQSAGKPGNNTKQTRITDRSKLFPFSFPPFSPQE